MNLFWRQECLLSLDQFCDCRWCDTFEDQGDSGDKMWISPKVASLQMSSSPIESYHSSKNAGELLVCSYGASLERLSFKCTGVAGLWSPLANRKGQPKLHPPGSNPWNTQIELDNNAVDIVEKKRPGHKRPLLPLCWNSGLCFGHQASTLQNSLSGERKRDRKYIAGLHLI